MAVPYKRWLEATGREHTPENAHQWKVTHGYQLGLWTREGRPINQQTGEPEPDPMITDPNRPRFTPGTLDEAGELEAARLTRETQEFQSDIGKMYQRVLTELMSRRPRIEQEHKEGQRGVRSAHAARGTLRSGIKMEDDTRLATEAMEAHADVNRNLLEAESDYRSGVDRSRTDYTTGLASNLIDANTREFLKWQERNPLTVDPKMADPKTKETAQRKLADHVVWRGKSAPNPAAVKAGQRAVERGGGKGWIITTKPKPKR